MVLIFISVFSADSKSIDTLKLKKNKKFYTFLAAEGIVLTGGITYLSKQWYSDKKEFHFISIMI